MAWKDKIRGVVRVMGISSGSSGRVHPDKSSRSMFVSSKSLSQPPRTPFFEAVMNSATSEEEFEQELILQEDVDAVDLDDRFQLRRTALHYAASLADVAKVKALLDAGADPSIKDETGLLPIHHAVEGIDKIESDAIKNDGSGNWKVNPHLADAKIDVNIVMQIVTLFHQHPKCSVNAAAVNGQTVLHMASSVNGKGSLTRKLVALGADSLANDNLNRTPLHLAVWCGDEAQVGIILANTPPELIDKAVGAKNAIGRTPLHVAAVYGRTEITQLLLEYGSDLEATTNDGKTPLMVCVEDRFRECATALIEAGADDMTVTNDGRTPLIECITKLPQIAPKLLDRRQRVVSSLYGNVSDVEYNIRDVACPPSNFRAASLKAMSTKNDVSSSSEDEITAIKAAVLCGNQQVVSHPLMLVLLTEMWNVFAYRIFVKQLLYFVLYLVFWIIALTDVQYPAMFDLSKGYEILRLMACLAFAWMSVFRFSDAVRTVHLKRKLGRSVNASNVYSVVSAALPLGFCVVFAVAMSDPTDVTNRAVLWRTASVVTLMLWSNLLRFASVWRLTGPLIRSMVRMLHNLFVFSLPFGFILLGFSHAFYLVGREVLRTDNDAMEMDDDIRKSFHEWEWILLQLFRLMTGEFDFELLTVTKDVQLIVLWVVYVGIGFILMLNLLIAMMNQSFEDIHSRSSKEWALAWAKTILSILEKDASVRDCWLKFVADNPSIVRETATQAEDTEIQQVKAELVRLRESQTKNFAKLQKMIKSRGMGNRPLLKKVVEESDTDSMMDSGKESDVTMSVVQ